MAQSGVREILRRLQHDSENSHEFHAFRRFYGLSLYNETHDIYFVSRMLDHSNIEVTKRYLDIKQEDDLAKASKLSPMDKKKSRFSSGLDLIYIFLLSIDSWIRSRMI